MKIEHVALWTRKLEAMREFYTHYFDAKAGPKYKNESKDFESYFLHFEDGARLELMHTPGIPDPNNDPLKEHIGIIHIAISVGSRERVIELTHQLESDGYDVIGNPRTTGDGYFESVVLDPERNRIEITV